jgi:UDP-glucose 4-epimerase
MRPTTSGSRADRTMRILVTGGAGYIGAVSATHLLDEGHDVLVVDTLERGFRKAVDPRAQLVVCDVGDRASMAELLRGCDAVLHCAGYIEVAESQREPLKYFENNVWHAGILLAAMDEANVEHLVFSSTAAVYGEPETMPITEDTQCRPINNYGTSKLHFEEIVEAAERANDLTSVRLRYFNVAGASEDGTIGEAHRPETHMIPRILDALYRGAAEFEVFGDDYPTEDGTCVRDYIHVVDLAQAHRLALERLVGGGEGGVFNLGNGRGYSNLEVVRACAEATGREVEIRVGPRREGDPAVLIASNEKAKSELGWTPARSDLRTMIDDAWAFKRAHPDGY